MKTKIKNFVISANSAPVSAPCPWDGKMNHNLYTIEVKNTENGKSLCFDFFTSRAHPEIIEEWQLKDAFDCFLNDCDGGALDFEDFCNELGYFEDEEEEARSIWRSCVHAFEEFQEIASGDFDLWEIREAARGE